MPIHYGDYPVFKSPLQAFLDRAREGGLSAKVRTVERGETLTLD